MKLKPELQQEPCKQQQSRVANGDTPESGAMPIARPPHDPRKGIATTYAGVNYRSRLEARWADMFVRLGIPASYEAIDLEWYIPDFRADFEASPLLIEVKDESQYDELRAYAPKVVASGWRKDFLILGDRLFENGGVGLFAELDGPGFVYDRALVLACISCGRASFVPENGSWRCRRCGADDGAGHAGWFEQGELDAMWAAAGNRVQWKPGSR